MSQFRQTPDDGALPDIVPRAHPDSPVAQKKEQHVDPFKGLIDRILSARAQRAVALGIEEEDEDESDASLSPSPKHASPRRSPRKSARRRTARIRSAVARSPQNKPSTLPVPNGDGSEVKPVMQSKQAERIPRQPREEFTATAVSPIGRMYLQQRGKSKTETRPGFVYRTILDERCPFGGTDNLAKHNHYDKINEQSEESHQV